VVNCSSDKEFELTGVAVLMDALWSLFALATVMLKPHRATSALLMTGLNHAVFGTIMTLRSGVRFQEIIGLSLEKEEKSMQE
jgi:hypothetical protein